MKEIRRTVTFNAWIVALNVTVASRIQARIDRVEAGNFGDHKRFDGLIELRFSFGAGYRIYCVERGRTVVILLAGGDKSSQKMDIKLAKRLAHNL